jgi:putative transposase
MTQRHPIQQNATMFVTTNTKNWQPFFADPAFAREAVECLYRVKQLHPFYLYGFVIMPDHCHFLMNVPAPETMANVVGTFKSGMTFNTGIQKMWQGRYHCKIIGSKAINVLRYIHQNPVKAGFVENAWDYPWSSANSEWQVDSLGYE